MIERRLLFYTGFQLLLFIAIKSLSRLYNHKLYAARTVKPILNKRCCFQFNFCNTPPQEQGKCGMNKSI